MIRSILSLTLLALLSVSITACNTSTSGDSTDIPGDRNLLASQIRALEEELLNKINEPTLDTITANDLIEKSQAFAKQFPQDTLSPEFLFRAADVSRGIGEFDSAIQMWNQVEKQYQSYKKAPEALFLQGFTYDNNLGELKKASQKYELFLKKYPKHPIANDVQMLLEVAKTGKSPEELIKEFQQNQEE